MERRASVTAALLAMAAILAAPPSAAGCEHPEDASMPQEVECEELEASEGGPQNNASVLRIPSEAWWMAGGVAAMGLGGVAFVLRGLWLPPLRVVVAPLFARLTRRDITDHPVRSRILAIVARQPGVSAAEISDQEGINIGTLDYHLDILLRDGQVRAAKAGRNRLLFLPGSGADVARVGEVSAPGRGDLARAILQEPGLHAAALAERLGLSRATVHHHLGRLEAAGLIRIERGLRARCFPTQLLPSVLGPPRRRRIAVVVDSARPTSHPSDGKKKPAPAT